MKPFQLRTLVGFWVGSRNDFELPIRKEGSDLLTHTLKNFLRLRRVLLFTSKSVNPASEISKNIPNVYLHHQFESAAKCFNLSLGYRVSSLVAKEAIDRSRFDPVKCLHGVGPSESKQIVAVEAGCPASAFENAPSPCVMPRVRNKVFAGPDRYQQGSDFVEITVDPGGGSMVKPLVYFGPGVFSAGPKFKSEPQFIPK